MKVIWMMGCLLLGMAEIAVAQENEDIEKLLDANEVMHSDDQYEDMLTVLQRLQLTPLNLNTVDFDSLKLLFFLSDSQIDNLLAFRKKYGVFLSPEELLLVPGIGRRDLENIRQFVFTEKGNFPQRIKAIRTGTRQELIVRGKITLPLQEGYRNYSPEDFKTEDQYLKKLRSRFQGIPLGSLIRYKAQVYSHLQLGLTLENDPGEAYFTKNQKSGFDFCSAYAAVSTEGWMKKMIAGDYRLQWGQGLVAWGGFASGKSAVALGNEKSARAVSPYSSTDENNYFRGVAFALEPFSHMAAEVFFSYKKTDGNLLETDRLSEEDRLTASLYQSGYHRNENECAKKHTLGELTTGVSVNWNTSYFKAGIHTLYYDFRPGLETGGKVYQRYNDNGQERLLTGIDYKTGFRNLYLFGETAFSEKGEVATLNGLRFSGSSRIAFCLLYRRYSKGYISHYAGGFGEYSNTSNEEGIYLGMDLNLTKKLKISAYYDYFRFFSARYRATNPASGSEMLVNVAYEHLQFDHNLRFKYEEKPEDLKGLIFATVWRKKLELRYQFGFKWGRRLEMRTRWDWVHYAKGGKRENGYMVCQDFIFANRRGNFKMQFRMAYFNTDSYNSRIYSYEHNVLYGYSFPASYDRGLRTYLNLNWKAAGWLTFYMKSGLSYYPDRENIGSSVTAINDNKILDFTLQVRVRF